MKTRVQILRYEGDPNEGTGRYRYEGTALDPWRDGWEAIRQATDHLAREHCVVIQVFAIPNPHWASYPHYGLLYQSPE